jgi:hypothetical protein
MIQLDAPIIAATSPQLRFAEYHLISTPEGKVSSIIAFTVHDEDGVRLNGEYGTKVLRLDGEYHNEFWKTFTTGGKIAVAALVGLGFTEEQAQSKLPADFEETFLNPTIVDPV